MHAIIPVAGFGTRLRPHTFTLPKVLLNVAGKPILAHILERIIESGVTSATIVVGYLGEAIRDFVTSHYPNLPTRFIEQTEVLGLGHAIWMAREDIPSKPDETLFIVLGDTIFDADLKSVFSGKTSALGVYHVDDPRRFGVVESEGGVATKLVEKPEHPKSNWMIAGLYYFKNPPLLRAALDELIESDKRTKNEYQLTDALQLMIDRGEKFATFELSGWYDCGKPETLLSTNRAMLDKKSQSRSLDRTVIREPVFIADTAEIEDAVIGPYASIGARTKIKNAIIRDSIVGDETEVDSAVLSESIVGNNTIVRGTFREINIGDYSEVNLG
ncbi:MAG TPA: sugar phosphate nucleotidyltransferase [Candidatus Kapabacteria bacterium]|jgi:glucose-1-phosphate thymidylyltransferase